MSNQPQEPAFPQGSYDLLVQKIHKPVFLEKLARDYNVVAQTPQEEFQLLELAGMLRQAKETEAVKQASAGGNHFLTDASDSLKSAMASLGYGRLPSTHDRQIKQAAAGAAQDPQIQNAVLEFGSYLGQLQAAAG
jgi:hypothetical protein